MDENNQVTKQWSSLFENKVDTLITNIEKVQGPVTDTNSKIEMNNDRQRRQNNLTVYNLSEDVGKSRRKKTRVRAPERRNRQKNRKRNPENVQNWQKKLKNLRDRGPC